VQLSETSRAQKVLSTSFLLRKCNRNLHAHRFQAFPRDNLAVAEAFAWDWRGGTKELHNLGAISCTGYT
jgi:hypothetical protein